MKFTRPEPDGLFSDEVQFDAETHGDGFLEAMAEVLPARKAAGIVTLYLLANVKPR